MGDLGVKEEIKAALHEYRREIEREREREKKRRKEEEEKREAFYYIVLEILVFSVILGIHFKSWWVFGGSLIGFIVCYLLPYIGVILSIGFSVLWGYLAYLFLDNFSSTIRTIGVVLAFIMSLGMHLYPKMDDD
jgi:cation transport ATPase